MRSFHKQLSEVNKCQMQEIKKAVLRAHQPSAKFIEHQEVAAWLDSRGSKNELKSPKCSQRKLNRRVTAVQK